MHAWILVCHVLLALRILAFPFEQLTNVLSRENVRSKLEVKLLLDRSDERSEIQSSKRERKLTARYTNTFLKINIFTAMPFRE